MAKLADALALGASGVTHGGSSPLSGTDLFYMYPVINTVFTRYLYVFHLNFLYILDIDKGMKIV